jgi:hypothetical protein
VFACVRMKPRPCGGILGVFPAHPKSDDTPKCELRAKSRISSECKCLCRTFSDEFLRKGPLFSLEFESRVRIRTEMTDVGQGRHYLFTPEMTALRPVSDIR